MISGMNDLWHLAPPSTISLVPRLLFAVAPRLSWGETHTGLDGV